MTTFPALYREHVQPRLERECRVRGTFVALGMETFGEACASIHRLAYARGAGYLPEHLHDSLIDWILSRLLHHVCAADAIPTDPDIEALPDQIRSGADFAAWQRVLAKCREPACQTMTTP